MADTNNPTVVQRDDANAVENTRGDRYFRPLVDILEKEDALWLVADMPGVRSEDVDVQFEDGTLTLHGRVRPRGEADTKFLRQEYTIGDFYRTFRVSEQIDASKISAECGEGVLTLRLPKVEAVKPRKIAVQGK